MKLNKETGRSVLVASLLSASCGLASAGRPLVVDDANVNEVGSGHIEVWLERASGATTYNLAPAYAPVEGLEIGALLARRPDAATTATALQVKWRITTSQENGCNFGAVAGVAHASGGGNAAYLNGLFTCNSEVLGSMHVNLGASKAKASSTNHAWGIAFEREFSGVTPHIEWFGGEDTKATVQVGLRGNIANNVQLDGSVGRSDGVTRYTLGMKFQF